jgi:hypothetical protein
VVTNEQRDEIVRTARETIERVDRTLSAAPDRELEIRLARYRREPDEEEILHTDPLMTPPAPAIEPPPVIAEDYISELIATVIAEVTAEYDRKLGALRAEVREIRTTALGDFAQNLKHAVARVDELVTKLDRTREPERGTVIDMPNPLPSRRDYN